MISYTNETVLRLIPLWFVNECRDTYVFKFELDDTQVHIITAQYIEYLHNVIDYLEAE